MSSPVGSRTPRRDGRATPSRREGTTPRRDVIPETPTRTSRANDGPTSTQGTKSDAGTPMRWGANIHENGANTTSSSPPAIIPTSPAAGKRNVAHFLLVLPWGYLKSVS